MEDDGGQTNKATSSYNHVIGSRAPVVGVEHIERHSSDDVDSVSIRGVNTSAPHIGDNNVKRLSAGSGRYSGRLVE